MKCGTTSLHEYLSTHPEIFMSRTKEIDYFSKYYDRGADWYRSHFPESTPIRGEASTSYTKYPTFTDVPKRMYALLPEARLVYIVRDPIERMISHYLHEKTRRRERRPIDQALADPTNNIYLMYSLYYQQLKQYLNWYPLESILVLETDDLRDKRLGTLRTVGRFLDIDDKCENNALRRLHNQTSDRNIKTRLGTWLLSTGIPDMLYQKLPSSLWKLGKTLTQARRATVRPVLDDNLRNILMGYVQSDIDALRHLTGKTFENW